MSLCLKMAKNRYLSFLLMISVYVVALLISITIANRTSLVNFKIEPYTSGSNSVDFFFASDSYCTIYLGNILYEERQFFKYFRM